LEGNLVKEYLLCIYSAATDKKGGIKIQMYWQLHWRDSQTPDGFSNPRRIVNPQIDSQTPDGFSNPKWILKLQMDSQAMYGLADDYIVEISLYFF